MGLRPSPASTWQPRRCPVAPFANLQDQFAALQRRFDDLREAHRTQSQSASSSSTVDHSCPFVDAAWLPGRGACAGPLPPGQSPVRVDLVGCQSRPTLDPTNPCPRPLSNRSGPPSVAGVRPLAPTPTPPTQAKEGVCLRQVGARHPAPGGEVPPSPREGGGARRAYCPS